MQALEAALGTIVMATIALCIVGWIGAIRRVMQGQAIVDYTAAFRVPWRLLDIVLVVLLAMIAIGISQAAAVWAMGLPLDKPIEEDDVSTRLNVIGAFSVSVFLVLPLAAWLVMQRSGATLSDLGWPTKPILQDLQLGVIAFAMLAVPVFAIQICLTQFFPSEHPFIKILLDEPKPQYFVIVIFAAVIQAPLAEEFFFRALVQGWLEKMCYDPPRRPAVGDVFTDFAGDHAYGGEEVAPRSDVVAMNVENPCATNLIATSSAPDLNGSGVVSSADECYRSLPSSRVIRWAPIIASSLLFAAAHFSHGPDPIPLFVLAMGLGYLYRQTHRLLPCIVVHVLLNGLSTLQLLLLTLAGKQLP